MSSDLDNPALSESEARSKLTELGISVRGWAKEHTRRVETAGAIEIIDGKPRGRGLEPAKSYARYKRLNVCRSAGSVLFSVTKPTQLCGEATPTSIIAAERS